jgi:polyisoprenoid-binding protein YceI
MRALKWVLISAGALIALVVGGTWFYINVIRGDAPAPLSFQGRDTATSTTGAPGTTRAGTSPASTAPNTTLSGEAASLAGKWTATPESQAGYRVKEILFGQSTEGVGRTNAVTGEFQIEASGVGAASFVVDLKQVTSDQSQRDAQFRGRIMNVSSFPTATFKLTAPIAIGTAPGDRQEMTFKATGDLTLRGTTKPVTFDLIARRNGANIEIEGSIPIVFADWGIPSPSGGPARTEDHGEIEFLLVFVRSG